VASKIFIEPFTPGTFTSLDRIGKAAFGVQSESGRAYGLFNELASVMAGQRVSEMDAQQALQFKGSRFMREMRDASALFNLLTGYSQGHDWQRLVVAPNDLHRRTLELIQEQARRAQAGQPARIFAKLNSLVDHRVIEALYEASQAGVPIDILARGICCLRPGVPGLSETIRVRSIVDRFLEHSRLYVFGADDEAQVFLASADWMPRNFFRRVEVMFPILAPDLRQRILKEIVPVYLADNTRARQLDPSGVFHLLHPQEGQPAVRSQIEFLERRVSAEANAPA
jgi:polyphosphate kinase 1